MGGASPYARRDNERGPLVADQPALRRDLGLWHVSTAGVGVILGAGIYVLIGVATERAGAVVWGSFVAAAVAVSFTALSYGELASMFPRAGAGYEYVRQAFNVHVGFLEGWMTVWAEIIAAAAVALGFGAYLEELTGIDHVTGAIVLLIVGSFIAASGVLRSVLVVAVLTAAEVGGLLIVSAIGFTDFDPGRLTGDVAVLPFLSGTALLVFAFLGFEDVATLAEEAKSPERTIPLAIVISLVFATAVYVTVAVASVGSIGAEALGEASAPLATVAAIVLGARAGDFLALFGMAAAGNTALLLIMACCRRIYGMASTGAIPPGFARVSGTTRVPVAGLLIVGGIASLMALWGDIGKVADVTNFALFVAFAAVNLAVIALRLRRPAAPRPFRLPGTVPFVPWKGVPVIPVLGLLSLALLAANLDRTSTVGGLTLTAVGVVIAVAFRGRRAAAERAAYEAESART
ncbi:MAG: APC family permease [Dehalococcoidia bacterium]